MFLPWTSFSLVFRPWGLAREEPERLQKSKAGSSAGAAEDKYSKAELPVMPLGRGTVSL